MISFSLPFPASNSRPVPFDILRTLARICLFSAGPQDLPSSRQLLVGCVAATLVVLFIGYRMLVPGVNPLVLAAIHALLLGLGWIILLQITGKMERWHQSVSAVYGCAAILNLVSLPIVASGITNGALEQGDRPGLVSFTLIALWIWEIGVTARIIRESIEVRLGSAIGISLLMSFALQFAMVSMFSQVT